jgi:hypothetical protein
MQGREKWWRHTQWSYDTLLDAWLENGCSRRRVGSAEYVEDEPPPRARPDTTADGKEKYARSKR